MKGIPGWLGDYLLISLPLDWSQTCRSLGRGGEQGARAWPAVTVRGYPQGHGSIPGPC